MADIPLVATGDVHYINLEDKTAYTCLKAIKRATAEVEEDQAKAFQNLLKK
ncbi:hypothetical protein ACEQPO_21760 [Bacillus sp. SL00103]